MLAPLGEEEANGGREMGDFMYRDWGGSLPNKGEGRRGEGEEEEEEEEEAGPKAEEEQGKSRREGGEGQGGDCVLLLDDAGEYLQRSVWGCDGRP